MPDARADILARIRAVTPWTADDESASSTNTFVRSSCLSRSELIRLLKDRLHDYDAQVVECSSESVRVTLATMLRARGVSHIVLPAGLPPSLLPDEVDFLLDEQLSNAELDRCEGVLTLSTLAIAETGTIVLQNVPGQGRRAATLVPDYHLCVVAVANIVATVPEAIANLRATAHLPTTFISGPSATADIEMTRIKGVHGPRHLDVVIVTDGVIE